jgi:hypothetical protein
MADITVSHGECLLSIPREALWLAFEVFSAVAAALGLWGLSRIQACSPGRPEVTYLFRASGTV